MIGGQQGKNFYSHIGGMVTEKRPPRHDAGKKKVYHYIR
jgi:hypothetical protein